VIGPYQLQAAIAALRAPGPLDRPGRLAGHRHPVRPAARRGADPGRGADVVAVAMPPSRPTAWH
jgi:hypothetical protein